MHACCTAVGLTIPRVLQTLQSQSLRPRDLNEDAMLGADVDGSPAERSSATDGGDPSSFSLAALESAARLTSFDLAAPSEGATRFRLTDGFAKREMSMDDN